MTLENTHAKVSVLQCAGIMDAVLPETRALLKRLVTDAETRTAEGDATTLGEAFRAQLQSIAENTQEPMRVRGLAHLWWVSLADFVPDKDENRQPVPHEE